MGSSLLRILLVLRSSAEPHIACEMSLDLMGIKEPELVAGIGVRRSRQLPCRFVKVTNEPFYLALAVAPFPIRCVWLTCKVRCGPDRPEPPSDHPAGREYRYFPVGMIPAFSTIRITVRSGARVRCITPFGTTKPCWARLVTGTERQLT